MAMTTVWFKIGEGRMVEGLRTVQDEMDSSEGDVALDLSAVCRIDAIALRALEEFAIRAEDKRVKVTLRGVNVRIYKVLKLMRLTSRFSFVN